MKRKWIIAAACACALIFAGCSSDTATENAPEAVEEITIINEENVPTSYDCIVVDGSPEGVTAAISAARNGLSTLLICQDEALGGLYTLGELNYIDVPESRDGTVLVEGIYKEFYDAVGGSGFDVTVAKNTFYEMVQAEDNITLRVQSKFVEPVLEDHAVTGVTVEEDGERVTYTAPVVIDATPDGDVCAAAGCDYTFAGEDIGERDREMGVTLVFRLSKARPKAASTATSPGATAQRATPTSQRTTPCACAGSTLRARRTATCSSMPSSFLTSTPSTPKAAPKASPAARKNCRASLSI